MANVTPAFIGNRKTFLETRIVLVVEPVDKKVGPRPFWFDDVGNYVKLKAGSPGASDADKTTVTAYWLNWGDKIAVLDLAGGADYFFTSQMTGCTFRVLTTSATHPKVAHIPGTGIPGVRAREEKAIVDAIPEGDRAAGRVLSPGGGDVHKYRGQNSLGKQGSAFVLGCKDGDGNWAFEAQIVKGNLADEFAFKVAIKNDGVPRIAKLFEFH